METFDKVVCRVKIRPLYKGRKPKENIQELNGRVYLMHVLWQCEDDESYPGEYALAPYDKGENEEWFRKYNVGWIASGDVEMLEGVHGEKELNSAITLQRAGDSDCAGHKIMTIARGINKPPAMSIRLRSFVDEGVETFVVCGGSFAAYNKLIDYDELQRIVDGMGETDRISNLWRSEQEGKT